MPTMTASRMPPSPASTATTRNRARDCATGREAGPGTRDPAPPETVAASEAFAAAATTPLPDLDEVTDLRAGALDRARRKLQHAVRGGHEGHHAEPGPEPALRGDDLARAVGGRIGAPEE